MSTIANACPGRAPVQFMGELGKVVQYHAHESAGRIVFGGDDDHVPHLWTHKRGPVRGDVLSGLPSAARTIHVCRHCGCLYWKAEGE